MMDGTARVLTISAATGAAVVGGVFFAFSSFVMKALADLADEQGIAAMQSVNRQAPTPIFMAVLLGTAAVCVAVIGVGVRDRGHPASTLQVIGGVLYLAGIVLTVAYHVPRNDALALVDAASPRARDIWATYVRTWTLWNHVRTLTSVAGAVVLSLALVV